MRAPSRRPVLIPALIGLVVLAGAPLAWSQSAPAPAPAPTVQAAPQPPAPPIYDYEIVNTYPHDPAAFTQGLIYRDGVLIESTGRHPSSVRRVRLEDGVVLEKKELPVEHFGEGLTDWGDRVLTLTWQGGQGFIWDADDLDPAGTWTYEGEGWGLTRDATRIILSDGSPSLRFFDPETLTQTGVVPVTYRGRPVPKLNELEFIDGEVFANVWQTNFILRIDPATGVVKGIIDLTGLLPDPVANPNDDVLNGIAWDPAGRRLFVTGKNWPRLFEIRLVPRPPAAG
ncbi:glutaminyl-peptide cyclotransferase [Brevundimonas subvibrioides]|uniref:Glutamine cyclotransferase n=1 Tax=Brevundimonas subvibrioides (strain ATCC 15264 / DSM 4735 / LMG 14903 / NBRC 16000 / CB 81) TaxID=633149 RepID=D9QIX8_BRESC|nr:glutaminyl-peptide cyclotransferase [Brevundimonas subvibrioides]ADK99502.1 glutamine cyclotransferase [Brevundimonas subvibrioides ATCC 15264]